MKGATHRYGLIVLAALSTLLPGCKAKRYYPEPGAGWHSPNFSVLYGRIRRVPGTNSDAPPIWVIRFGRPDDVYNGELALTPPERLTGYSGGEQVEIHGHIQTGPATDGYNGHWYVVDAIQLWSDYQ